MALVPLLGIGGFMAWKTRAVARELVDPPFYRPQPLARVDATYRELAEGRDGDPGGAWASEEVDGLQLWRFTRPTPAPGVVLLLHGFGDDRWGTSPALKWFPRLDAAIFTYRRRDDALRRGGPAPAVTFGALESRDVVRIVHHLEASGLERRRILLMGRSLGASVGLLALGYGEEWLWDLGIWHDHPDLFGAGWQLGGTAQALLVPLLALPQAVHYALDGFIWRRGEGPPAAAPPASSAPPG